MLSRRRWLNGVLVSSLGNASLNAARDAVVGWAPPLKRRVAEARASTWSLAKAVLQLRAGLLPPVLQPLRRGIQYPREQRR